MGGNMDERLDFFRSQLDCCMLCPRECGVARTRGELGFCEAGPDLKVSSFCLHTGEEPPVSSGRGSGTIFFTHCSMACVYCQNFPISQLGHGNPTGLEDLVQMMLTLQQRGAANINLVTPTHFLPPIVEAILTARQRGLMLPIVYNTGGYEKAETMAMLEGIVQVYLVDMRYFGDDSAIRYSSAPHYHRNNTRAIMEMIRQVGPLSCANGAAQQGVIIRHLLLPSLMEETRHILAFVATSLPPDTPVSLMSQYFPAHRAHDFPELSRKITEQEYDRALILLEDYGLTTGWVQELGPTSLPVA
jgi:putative pyruvate formate lyase activating enzyme